MADAPAAQANTAAPARPALAPPRVDGRGAGERARELGRLRRLGRRAEDTAAIALLALASVLPLAELAVREGFGSGVPGTIPIVQHLTLLIAFVGAGLAARSDRLLALSTGQFLPARWQAYARPVRSFLAVAVTSLLAIAAGKLVATDFGYGDVAAWGLPVWVFTAVMPLAFGLIALRLVAAAGGGWRGRAVATAGLLAALALALVPQPPSGALVLALGLVLAVGTVLGMPIFTAIGGIALLLFWQEGSPLADVPGEAYRISTSPMLPALPLFTLAGYVLAEGGSSRRLLRLFSALVGWMPGGLAVVVALLLAFFTPLTGASGITILAMGGLLLPMLTDGRYSERDALGLVTVSGSIGVLFPPSLPVLLYAYYADVDLEKLFVAGALPGVVLVAAVAAWGAWRGAAGRAIRTPFDARELAAAAWQARWELLLPVVILGGLFGGFATLVEASALTVLYAVLLECVLLRELPWRRALDVAVESVTLIGGFMIIVSVALGLTSYLVVAEIPMHVLDAVRRIIHSPWVFLLALNALLIVIGALMDIYSAIIVLVPLLAPLAAAYAIDPVHLGVIFLANMELGYLVPPMGENLFLSAYRFDKPLGELYRCVLPYMLILLAVVLLITYVPALTLQ